MVRHGLIARFLSPYTVIGRCWDCNSPDYTVHGVLRRQSRSRLVFALVELTLGVVLIWVFDQTTGGIVALVGVLYTLLDLITLPSYIMCERCQDTNVSGAGVFGSEDFTPTRVYDSPYKLRNILRVFFGSDKGEAEDEHY